MDENEHRKMTAEYKTLAEEICKELQTITGAHCEIESEGMADNCVIGCGQVSYFLKFDPWKQKGKCAISANFPRNYDGGLNGPTNLPSPLGEENYTIHVSKDRGAKAIATAINSRLMEQTKVATEYFLSQNKEVWAHRNAAACVEIDLVEILGPVYGYRWNHLTEKGRDNRKSTNPNKMRAEYGVCTRGVGFECDISPYNGNEVQFQIRCTPEKAKLLARFIVDNEIAEVPE